MNAVNQNPLTYKQWLSLKSTPFLLYVKSKLSKKLKNATTQQQYIQSSNSLILIEEEIQARNYYH